MIPKSWFVLEARVADKLATASLDAIENGWRLAGAVVYCAGKFLRRASLVENISEDPGVMRWHREKLNKALSTVPPQCDPGVLFHSQCFSDYLSRSTILGTPPRKKVLVFETSPCEFYLFRISREARSVASSPNPSIEELGDVSKRGRLPLYVKTGIKALDDSIITGVKHEALVATVHREIRKTIRAEILSNTWTGKAQSLESLRRQTFRFSRLGRFFEGLQLYIPLNYDSGMRRTRRMRGLSEIEFQYLQDAADLHLFADSYVTSLEDCKGEFQGDEFQGFFDFLETRKGRHRG